MEYHLLAGNIKITVAVTLGPWYGKLIQCSLGF